MVGDSVKDDVVCGNRAGSVTVLIDFEGAEAVCVRHVRHVCGICRAQCTLRRPPQPGDWHTHSPCVLPALRLALRRRFAPHSDQVPHRVLSAALRAAGKAQPQAPQGFEALQGELRPTHVVGGLTELTALLRDKYELVPPPRPHAAVEGAR